ncbi:MAG TPA: methyltransferase, partial [Thermoanaerobaculia bacterium]
MTPSDESYAPSVDHALIQMLSGMWTMQSVATAARLGIPDALAAGPLTPTEVAAKVGGHPEAVSRLLRGIASVGMLARDGDGKYRLTPLGHRLRADVPGTFKDAFIAEADTVHWRCWEVLADSVRDGKPRPQAVFGMPAFDYYGKHPAEGEQFGRAMENISRFASGAVLEAFDFAGVRTIMDVGGGNGSLALTILERHPGLRGKVVDLPYMAPAAHAGIRSAGAGDRCGFEACNFFEAVPKGADLQVLKFILHDWNDEECATILRRCRESLEPGGRILAVEMLVPDEIRPDLVMLMDLNMLVVTGGRERTEKQYESLFAQAGLRLTRILPT